MGISMLIMIKEDMFANKLMAMYERLGKTNRDIFDVYSFAKDNWPINKELVEKRAGMPFKKFLQKLISALEDFNDYNILDGLGELITEKKIGNGISLLIFAGIVEGIPISIQQTIATFSMDQIVNF